MKSKKMLMGLVLAVLSVFAFAESGYKVTQVVGKVQYEVKPGVWENIEVGAELAASTVINTGVNSKLVLELDDSKITIKPMQKGTVEKVVAAMGVAKGGSKGKVKVATADTSDETEVSKGISTASSRASNAAKALEFEDEE